jgi:hypothetical protein
MDKIFDLQNKLQVDKYIYIYIHLFIYYLLWPCIEPPGRQAIMHLLVVSWGQIEALTPCVKPLELISTFAPIGMLDLG